MADKINQIELKKKIIRTRGRPFCSERFLIMGCYRISDKARKLRKQYFEKYGEMPRGMYYQEGETMKKYETYLEKEIRTSEASTIFTKPQKVRN